MVNYKNLFLQQSYDDQYDTYQLVLEGRVAAWDYIVLTASNEKQASAYRQQIEYRLAKGELPAQTKYLVLPDPDGQRVGSGGATLHVMNEIIKDAGKTDFAGLKILCIHSGGDSKRVPQYSVCGKLFSPVPRMLPDGRRSTLFDEFIICMSGVPSRMVDGMLLCSGDVLLLFNPLQIDFYTKGAAAFSIKEQVSTAKNHGVYLADDKGNVGRFLHKQTEEYLAEAGAVDARGNCNIDTGALIFDSGILNDLYELVNTEEKFAALVNEHVRLSLYADFSYPLASGATLEEYYTETPEGEFSPELKAARTRIFEVLHPYAMKLIRLSPAAFIHFGTTKELLRLMNEEMPDYRYLGWAAQVNSNVSDKPYATSNAYVSKRAVVGEGSYIEDSYLHRGAVVGKDCVISGVTLRNITVPDGSVLHGLKLDDGQFVVRQYGVQDNPKENKYFGQPIVGALWDAPLFPVCGTIQEAVEKTLRQQTAPVMLSLHDSFTQADALSVLPWQEKLGDKVRVESLLGAIEQGVPVTDAIAIFERGISDRALRYFQKEADELQESCLAEFSQKIRIYYYVSKVLAAHKHPDALAWSDRCFSLIGSSILAATLSGAQQEMAFSIVKNEVITRLPVRVNWGGGWSDTPPYCNEYGGTVLNAAITLNGQCPIEVTLRKMDKPVIALASTDLGSYHEFTDLAALQDCKDPSDVFALHKAALLACGVVPMVDATNEKTLAQILQGLGGGFYLNTRVINIPKGSGLGTSSILAGACVKGVFDFFGAEIDQDALYQRVLCMEQLMSTGGGWQDQVGGLAAGIKMVSAEKGLQQSVTCTPLCIAPATMQELDQRFAIIYTGQRRLARNLLREVVGKYIGNNPTSVRVLGEIQRMAVLMRFELEKGNVDAFAACMNEHWELSKQLDAGCTNTCIDQIFISIDDLIDGKMICGAGGGGFLQVVLKKGVSAAALQARVAEVFADSGVAVWDSEFLL